MTTKNLPVICVATTGRTGSSLTMQALSIGGLECVGDYPAFEPPETDAFGGEINRAWFAAQRGKAVKWHSPDAVTTPPDIEKATILVTRDALEQAKSSFKFMRLLFPGTVPETPSRDQILSMAEHLEEAERLCVAALPKVSIDFLRIRFEDLIINPRETMPQIAAFAGRHCARTLDAAAMASIVLPRGTGCRPDLSIESALIEGMKIARGKKS